ncbi:MAG: ribonuclease H-like domain-containing protein [Candidatus Moraniibacteriota bacterium]
MLECFWRDIKKYKQLVTFNGRTFDAPFLHLRSAILKIKPSRNLVPYRYDYKIHCDLLEQLSYYGASRRFNLDFYTKQFGIRSPKEEGVDGSMVSEMFRQGKCQEIARYCARDIKATAELFRYWEEYLRF